MTLKNDKTAPARDPKETRLARRVMPMIAADSALLPPDKWIIASLRGMYKTIEPFRRDVRAAAVVAGTAVGVALSLSVGIVAFTIFGAMTLTTALASAGIAGVTAAASWWRGQKIWNRAKAETLPLVKEEIGKRYVAFKAEEMMKAWKERRDALRAAKAPAAAAPAPAADAAAPAAAPAADKKPAPRLRDLFARKKPTGGDAPAAPSAPDSKGPKPR